MQHLLARKMIGQRLTEGPGGLADPGQHRCGGRGDVGFYILESQLELIGLARKPLGRRAELHPPKLGELHLEPLDEQVALAELGLRGDQHRLQEVDIVGEKIGVEGHGRS